MSQIICPERAELIDYLLGKVNDDEVIVALESHLQQCETCDETIRGLNLDSDTLNNWIGQAVEEKNEGTESAFVDNLIQRIQLSPGMARPVDAMTADRASEVLRLVQSAETHGLGQLGNYRLLELIGSGSTGVVFKAQDEQLNRMVALKVLRPSLGEAARQRFISEAQAAASIQHPNVVTIYQVGNAEGLAFIAMQWVPGESLEERLGRVTFVPEDHLKQLALQIASGLQAAHQNNLIHRDIKPANIWLADGTDEVKILDFGLARIPDDDPDLTNTGMLAGTPNFMSPEQAKGMELDGRSDLFSLGCTLYRATTGKLPFGAGSVLATLQSIQNYEPVAPSQLNPSVSDDFSDLIMCLLEKQVANRPDSAQSLAASLAQPRSSWDFIAAQHQPVKPLNRPARTQAVPLGKWIAVTAMIALTIWGWNIFGQQIIRIVNNEGELVIETSDENVEVRLIADGKVARVIDNVTLQSFDVKEGEYELKASAKTGGNTFVVQPNKLIMKRGGKQIVSVTQVFSNTDSSSNTAQNLATQPLYDGMTFDGWMSRLKRERSRTAYKDGILAIGVLSQENPGNLVRAKELVRALMRKHGGIIIGEDDSWPAIINSFFSQLTPQQVVQFALDELPVGNVRSREQLIWHVSTGGGIYRDDLRLANQHQEEVRRRVHDIIEVALGVIAQDNSAREQSEFLIYHGVLCASWPTGAIGSPLNAELPLELSRYIETKLYETDDLETQAFLASIVMASGTDQTTELFGYLLSHPDISTKRRNEMLNQSFLKKAPAEKFDLIVDDIFTVINTQSLLYPLVSERLLKDSRETGFPQKRAIDVKKDLMRAFSRKGKHALGALKYLDEIAKQDSDYGRAAQKAAKQIRDAAGADQIGEGSSVDPEFAFGSDVSAVAPDEYLGDLPVAPGPGSDDPESERKPPRTYDGKSSAQWLYTLDTEANPDVLDQALNALAVLIRFEEGLEEKAVAMFADLVKIKSRSSPGTRKFLDSLSEDRFITLLKDGLRDPKSHEYWHSSVYAIPDSKKRVITRELDELISILFQNSINQPIILMAVRFHSAFNRKNYTDPSEATVAPSDHILKSFEEAVLKTDDPDSRYWAAKEMVRTGGKSKMLTDIVLKWMSENESKGAFETTFFDTLPAISVKEYPQVLEIVKDVYNNEEILARLFNRVLTQNTYYDGPFNQELFETAQVNYSSRTPNPTVVRFWIVYELGKRGSDAESALPWLRELLKKDETENVEALAIVKRKMKAATFKTLLEKAIERIEHRN